MNTLLRRTSITVQSTSEKVIDALRSTACMTAANSFRNSFIPHSFQYVMIIARSVDGVAIAPIHISGTIEQCGTTCTVQYLIRPSIIMFFPTACLLLFLVYCWSITHTISDLWFYFILFFVSMLISFYQVSWRETTCDERIKRKLRETEVSNEHYQFEENV